MDEARWHGHRTCFVDGSGGSMPDTPVLQDAFGQSTVQRPGCGFPVAHLLGLCHAGTGVLLKLAVAPLLPHDLVQMQNARHGRSLQLGEHLSLGLWCYLGDTPAQAKQALQPMFEEHVKFAAPLGMLRYSPEQMRQMGPTGAARHIAAGVDFEDVLQKRAWICGTPAEIIDYLKDIEARYPGLEHLMLGFPFGATAEQFKAQLTRFAEKVIPAFQHPGVRAGG